MAATPPRVGQLVLCQQQEVTWCVLAPGAPGPSARSGNCTSGAGGLGGPEGGPAAVRGCCLSPPSIMTQKSRVGDAAWGSVTLGSGHSSGSPRLHPQPPRCLPGKGAPLSPPANGLAPVLEGAGTIVQGTMSPGSLRSLGRWGSPEEALPGRPSAFWKAFLGSLPRPHAVCVQRPMGPCGLAVGVRPWLLGSRGFPVQGKRGWRESGFCPGPSRWQRAGTRGLSWGGAGPSPICSEQSAALPGSVPSWPESGQKDIRASAGCALGQTPVRGNSGQREEDL